MGAVLIPVPSILSCGGDRLFMNDMSAIVKQWEQERGAPVTPAVLLEAERARNTVRMQQLQQQQEQQQSREKKSLSSSRARPSSSVFFLLAHRLFSGLDSLSVIGVQLLIHIFCLCGHSFSSSWSEALLTKRYESIQ